MKFDVLQFIDSDTLREMLRGKEFAPAVECILIAQSEKQNMDKKLRALIERGEAYTTADFRRGIYNLRVSNDFAVILDMYIEALIFAMNQTESEPSDEYLYYAPVFPYMEPCSTFAAAVERTGQEMNDGERAMILRQRADDSEAPAFRYYISKTGEIMDIRFDGDEDWNIKLAFAEIPHSFQTGDIICAEGYYFVAADESHADENARWLRNADHTDMGLNCIEFYPDKTHSCGGMFGPRNVPVLSAERVKPDDLPLEMRPLTGLHLLLKGKLQLTDFLESYSCGLLDELVSHLK